MFGMFFEAQKWMHNRVVWVLIQETKLPKMSRNIPKRDADAGNSRLPFDKLGVIS